MSKDLSEQEKVIDPAKRVEKVIAEKKLNCKVNEKGMLIKRTNLE